MTEQRWTEALGRTVTLRGLPDSNDDGGIWKEVFEHGYHIPPGEMPSPATVLDLGANIGLTAAHYGTLWPDASIIGVEMDYENAKIARQNAPGATILCCAVADRSGAGSYERTDRTAGLRLGPVAAGQLPITTISLRALVLGWFGGHPVDFVKMDVERSEWEILEAAADWAPLVRHLLVELHGDGHSQADYDTRIARACGLLGAVGFEARAHDAHPCAVWAWR